MPGLKRRVLFPDDHGAVSAVIAILLSAGVLMGMGALVVDVGRLYVEREMLQSGADAASWKVALACIATPASCTNTAQAANATSYANLNSLHGTASAQVCINNTGCPAWNTAVNCPALGPNPGNYVEVRTSTLRPDNTTLVPPSFAQAVVSGYQGKRVGACARVNWGPPIVEDVFALGISLCDWQRMTGNGTTFYGPLTTLLGGLPLGLGPVLGLPSPVGGVDSAIVASLPASVLGLTVPTCGILDSRPRGFAWVPTNPLDPNCVLDNATVGQMAVSYIISGLLSGFGCAQKLASYVGGPPVLIPIYDTTAKSLLSVAPAYHIVGFAPFVVTGYHFPVSGLLSGVSSLLNGSLAGALESVLCGLSDCIDGYFTKSLVPQNQPQFGTATTFGATVIGRTG